MEDVDDWDVGGGDRRLNGGGRAPARDGRRRGRNDKHGGGGGGRRRGGSRAVDISRALSRLLRHQANNAGIPLDQEGYAPLDRVLQWGPLRSLRVTVAEVQDVVAHNDKQRFALRWRDGGGGEDDGDDDDHKDDIRLDPLTDPTADAAALCIRANQGHSIPTVASDAGLLTPLDDPATAPPVVCHGTFFAFWPAIEASGGLRRMRRNHVHCGCLEETNPSAAAAGPHRPPPVVPGLRRDAQLYVFLDVRRALREDPALKWWRAANGVVLTEGNADGVVPARFFQRVVTTPVGAKLLPPAVRGDAHGGELELWRDGRKVADLPRDVVERARPPRGKEGVVVRRAAGTAAPDASKETTDAAAAEAKTKPKVGKDKKKKKKGQEEEKEPAADPGAAAVAAVKAETEALGGDGPEEMEIGL